MFKLPAKAIFTQLQVSGQCAITYSTFTRHARNYKETGFLPDDLDEGLREGRPNRVGVAQLGVLQQKVIDQCGVLQHPKKNLSTDILNMEKEKGVITKGPPSNATLKLCLQQCAAAEGVSVVRESSARPQGARRQMAGRSSRNCMSQICNLILSNFTPGKYEVPSNLQDPKKKWISTLIGMTQLFYILTTDNCWRSIVAYQLIKRLSLMKSFMPEYLLTQTCSRLHNSYNLL